MGWIGEQLQFIPVSGVAGADPRERVQAEGSGRRLGTVPLAAACSWIG